MTELKRSIGFGLLTFYGVGVMVGAGIYVLVGKVAGVAGPLTPLAFLAAGLAAALSAMAFAELSARIPESAGEAAYVRSAFGVGWFGDLTGVAVALVGIVSSAAILKGGVGYLMAFVDLPRAWLEIGVGVALGLVAMAGAVESLAFAAVLTAVEIAGLLLVGAAGMSAPSVVTFAEMADVGLVFSGAGPAVLAAATLAFFAFIGFEDMVNLVEEVRRPERTMPRAIVAALAITTALYCLVSIAAIHAVPADKLAASERPLALVFETGFDFSPTIILLIAVFATLNGVLAQLIMAARVFYGLGRRSPAFRWAHQAHPRFGTPTRATAAATGLVIALALAAPIVVLAEWTTTILLCIFVVVNAALIALQRKGPPPAGAPSVPMWIPPLAIVLCLVLLFA